MGWRKVKDVARCAEIVDLAQQARRNAKLVTAINGILPEWLASERLSYSFQDNGTLIVAAPGNMHRQVTQILPMIKRRLRATGIKRLLLKIA